MFMNICVYIYIYLTHTHNFGLLPLISLSVLIASLFAILLCPWVVILFLYHIDGFCVFDVFIVKYCMWALYTCICRDVYYIFINILIGFFALLK